MTEMGRVLAMKRRSCGFGSPQTLMARPEKFQFEPSEKKRGNMDCYFTPKQLAERWHITEQTLANWRSLQRGPPFIRISNRVLYPTQDVMDHEELQKQKTELKINSWPTKQR